jgi:ABC-type uncharacterized transport system substrate-binding protein
LGRRQPGGNVTGVSVDAGEEFVGKFIELLAEAVGRLSNVCLLGTPLGWQSPFAKTTREAAKKMNIPLRLEALQDPPKEAEYRRAFDSMERDHVDGVVVSSDSVKYTHRLLLGRLAQQYRLPAICSYSDSTDAGALMSYAFDLKAGDRRIAAQIVEILTVGIRQRCRIFRRATGSWSSTSRRRRSLASKFLQDWSLVQIG